MRWILLLFFVPRLNILPIALNGAFSARRNPFPRFALTAISVSGTPETDIAVKAKRGNGFLRALKAPFRAIGRMFRRGTKNNSKIQRISEKDIKNFESHPANATPAGTVASPPQPSGSASAQERMERGRALLNSGDLNGAIAELSTAASLDPKLSEA